MRENIRRVARLLSEAARELERMERHEERKKMKYIVVLFSIDGEYRSIEDHLWGFTVEEVLKIAPELDSRHIFYPLLGIAEVKLEERGINPRETNIVYFDLEPAGEKNYDIMVEELSKVLDLPMSISEVSKKIQEVYNRIWGEEEEFELKKTSRNKRRNKSDSYRR